MGAAAPSGRRLATPLTKHSAYSQRPLGGQSYPLGITRQAQIRNGASIYTGSRDLYTVLAQRRFRENELSRIQSGTLPPQYLPRYGCDAVEPGLTSSPKLNPRQKMMEHSRTEDASRRGCSSPTVQESISQSRIWKIKNTSSP